MTTVPGLDGVVVDHLADRLAVDTSAETWITGVQALRLVDFRRRPLGGLR